MKDTFYRRETKKLAIIDKPFSYEMKILLQPVTGGSIDLTKLNKSGIYYSSGGTFPEGNPQDSDEKDGWAVKMIYIKPQLYFQKYYDSAGTWIRSSHTNWQKV